MTLINGFESYVLIDTGDTHSFITPRFMNRLQIPVNRLNEGLIICTPLKEGIIVDDVYKGCRVNVRGCELGVYLISLDIQDFDVILGMNWLSIYLANVNYHTKMVCLRTLDGKEVEFKGEKIRVCGGLASTLTTRKLVRKGCELYLTYVKDEEREQMRLMEILVTREFLEVFPENLPGLPLGREVEVSIEVLPGTTLVS